MTYEEAIKQLEPIIKHDAYEDVFKDACKLAIKAMELQVAKKVEKDEYMFICPNCKGDLGVSYEDIMCGATPSKYCIHCGQKIDFGE